MKHISTILLTLLLLPNIALGQSVGVVLSGGGAKGIAHVGVLKVLEENNIPIDYICGTSMGAIVASLYASGYAPDEIRAILSSKDFEQWMYGNIDIQHQFYYKTKNTSPQWLTLSFFRTKNGFNIQLPTNLISPSQMDLRFMQYYASASASSNYDFNNLMIPFFCVATDVHNNKPIFLDSGNLPSAVRASMTFPGYFKPISIDSILLFDGGMENNFPTEEMAKRFNPDIIIGSKVSSNPDKPDAEDLYTQLENVFMKSTNYTMPPNGILIEPNVEKYGLLDFNFADTLYALGVKAAKAKINKIKAKITRTESKQTLIDKRLAFKNGLSPMIFKDIYITGADTKTTQYILRNIKRNRDTLSFEELENEYFKLLSDKLIKSIYPSTIFNEKTGYYDLYLDIKTKNSLALNVGGNLSSSLSSLVFLDIDYLFQKKNINNISANIYVGRMYNSAQISLRTDFPPRNPKKDKTISPFYIDFEATYNSWDYFDLTSRWTTDSDVPTEVWQKEMHIQTNIGRPISNRGLLYTGYSYGQTDDNYYQSNIIEDKDTYDKTIFNYSAVHASYEYSTLNYRQYANSGIFLKIKSQYISGTEKYTPGTTALINNPDTTSAWHSWFSARLNYEHYLPLKPWFKLGITCDLNLSNKSIFNNSMSTLLQTPAFTPLPQSKTLFVKNFRAFTWATAGLVPVFSINNALDIRSEVYLFQPYKYILSDNYTAALSEKFPSPRIMASLSAIYHSPIGPIALTGCYLMKEDSPFYFQLNMGFILFNNRGFD